jgi:glycosyltransferase involved in cell wall biosynthesis
LKAINEGVANNPRLDYVGPIYGDAKDTFFSDLDVFIFPTGYFNEAQPIVLYEAVAAGALVISVDRGAIREQIQGHYKVFECLNSLEMLVCDDLSTLCAIDSTHLTEKKNAAREFFREEQALSVQAIDRVVESLMNEAQIV